MIFEREVTEEEHNKLATKLRKDLIDGGKTEIEADQICAFSYDLVKLINKHRALGVETVVSNLRELVVAFSA